MRIREKIFLGFALYVVLAAILGFLSYRELRTISTRLRLVEIADDITNTILEVRRYEKLFLLLPENDSRHQLEQYLSHLRTDIDAIQDEIILEIGRQNHDMMRSAIREYEILFNKVAETLLKEAELTGRIRSEARRIERLLSDDSRGAFLEARKEEKNLMLFEDRASYEAFLLKLAVPPLSGRHDIGQYLSLVKALAGLYEREQKSVSAMRRKAQEIQSFTESLAKREREEIERILALSMRMLVGALVFILVVGIVINVRLASKISSPMRTLEMVTRRIAAGDFSETVSVEGTDEIASLQRSFNAMQEKLRDALKDLEMTVAQLRDKQSQLVEAEKLASIGILAAGIAHEINNPLTSILTFSNLMLEQTPEGASQREQLKMMAREAERARYIVRQLLDFARETPLKLVRIDINEPVREIVDSLTAQGLFQHIELSVNLAEDLPDINADPVRIGQVIMNILLNAAHAITPPGKITVQTRLAGGSVEVAVSDSGGGIEKAHLRRIFDPFFTTKPQDQGTGLGLAVSYGIMKKHGGDITVRSEPGKGSLFIIRVPVDEKA